MKFSQAQSEAYFELCKYRMKNVYLTWVEQFLDLNEDNIDTSVEFCINDIGLFYLKNMTTKIYP